MSELSSLPGITLKAIENLAKLKQKVSDLKVADFYYDMAAFFREELAAIIHFIYVKGIHAS